MQYAVDDLRGFYAGEPRVEALELVAKCIRIDAELLSEGSSLGQLDWNEAKIAAAITFANEETLNTCFEPAGGHYRSSMGTSAMI